MPNTKPSSQRIKDKSMSFHGRGSAVAAETGKLRRPKTLPNLPAAARIQPTLPRTESRPKLTKFLLNVTIQGSLGPLHVLLTPDSSVRDLIVASVRLYVKEARRPVLPATNPDAYDLHYSQFSLQSLNRDESLVELGSRNFFLCKRNEDASSSSSSSCSKQAEDSMTACGLPWLNLISFLQ